MNVQVFKNVLAARYSETPVTIYQYKRSNSLCFLTVHHSIDLLHLPTLMHNSIFINNMYVTLLHLANSLGITSLIRTLLLQYCFNNTVGLILI